MFSDCAFIELLKDGVIDLFSVEYNKDLDSLKLNFYFKKENQSAPHKISHMLNVSFLNNNNLLQRYKFIENYIRDMVVDQISKYEVK